MKETVIKDFYGKIIGRVREDQSTGRQTLLDFFNTIIGYYDPITNTTRNFYNQVVGQGNILLSLLNQNNK